MKHEFFKQAEEPVHSSNTEALSATMQSIFTKYNEEDHTGENTEVQQRAPSAAVAATTIDHDKRADYEVSEPSEPTLGPLSKSRLDADTVPPLSHIASVLENKTYVFEEYKDENYAEFNRQLERDKQDGQSMERSSDLNYKNLNSLIYQA